MVRVVYWETLDIIVDYTWVTQIASAYNVWKVVTNLWLLL